MLRKVAASAPSLFKQPSRTFMRLSLFLTPMSDHHLALAAQVQCVCPNCRLPFCHSRFRAQVGCSDIVSRYPGSKFEDLKTVVDKAAAKGLKVSVIERYLPHDQIVHNKVRRRPGRTHHPHD